MKRITVLLLALLLIPCLALGESAPEKIDVRIVIDGETVTVPGSGEDTVGAYIINGVLYIPAGLLPVSLGRDLSTEVMYVTDTNTLYIGDEVKHGLCWVLTGTDYEVEEAGHGGKETYAFEGATDFLVAFTRSGGYSDDSKWGVCNGVYECQIPPAAIYPGEAVSLTMRIRITDYSWKGSSTEINSVHIGSLFVELNGTSFENADGERDLHIGTAAGGPYTDCDTVREGVYSIRMPENQAEGDTAAITFHCQSGTYTWIYELRNR